MAETERTWPELQTLLGDNVGKAISARDLRDAMVTALGGYSCMVAEDNTVTQEVNGTPTVLEAFNASGVERGATADHEANTITIGTTGDYQVTFQTSATVGGGPSSLVTARVYADGSPVPGLKSERELQNESGSFGFSAIATINGGAVLDVRVTGTPTLIATFRDAQFVVKRVG